MKTTYALLHEKDHEDLFAPRVGGALEPQCRVWLTLQGGTNHKGDDRPNQNKIIRFNRFLSKLGHRMRLQNGYDHRASVQAVATECMIDMSSYVRLDQLLITRAFNHHDEPEGILGVDHPATEKKDVHDLEDYVIFEKLYRSMSAKVWAALQEAFLLQFCLTNPSCFPDDARQVMAWLARDHRHDALFFQAIQQYDYLLYGYDQLVNRGIVEIINEVSRNQMGSLDAMREELPGFREVVWTPERRKIFAKTYS